MKFRWLIVLLAISVFSVSAHAQIGIYGKFDANRFSDNSLPPYAPTTTWYTGIGEGVYYDFLHAGPIGFGADLRSNQLWGNQQKFRSFLFGLRLAAKPRILPIRPYVQASIGVSGPSHHGLQGIGTSYENKFQYQFLGGVDYTMGPHLDLRVIELGYGRMSGVSGGYPAPTATLFNLSSGLVFRFR